MRNYFQHSGLTLVLISIGISLTASSTAIGSPLRQSVEVDSTMKPTSKPTLNLPNIGPAPELANEIWLNADEPLRIGDLAGKVVLIDFWTFG